MAVQPEWRREAYALLDSTPERLLLLSRQIEQVVSAVRGSRAPSGALLPAPVSSPSLAGYVAARRPSMTAEDMQSGQLRCGAEAVRDYAGRLYDWRELVRGCLWRLTFYEARIERATSIGTPPALQVAAQLVPKSNDVVTQILKALADKRNEEQRFQEALTRVTPPPPPTTVPTRLPSDAGNTVSGAGPSAAYSRGDGSARGQPPTMRVEEEEEEVARPTSAEKTVPRPGLLIPIVNAGFDTTFGLAQNFMRPEDMRLPFREALPQAIGSGFRTGLRLGMGSIPFSHHSWPNAVLSGAFGAFFTVASNKGLNLFGNSLVQKVFNLGEKPLFQSANEGLTRLSLPSLTDPALTRLGSAAFNGLPPLELGLGRLSLDTPAIITPGLPGLSVEQVESLYTGTSTVHDYGRPSGPPDPGGPDGLFHPSQEFTAGATRTPLPPGWADHGVLPVDHPFRLSDVEKAPLPVQRQLEVFNNQYAIYSNVSSAILMEAGKQGLRFAGWDDNLWLSIGANSLANALSAGFTSRVVNGLFIAGDFVVPFAQNYLAETVAYSLLGAVPPVQQAMLQVCPAETRGIGDVAKQLFCTVGENSSPPTQGNDDDTASGGSTSDRDGPLALVTSTPVDAGSPAVTVGSTPPPAPEHAAGTVTTRLDGAGPGSQAGQVTMTYRSDGSVSVGVDSTQVDRNGTSTLFTPVPPGAQQQQWNLDPDARTNYAAVLPAGHDPGNPGSWPVAERTVRYESETTTLVGDGRPDTLEGWVMRAPDASNHQKEDIFVVPAQRTNADWSTDYFLQVPAGHQAPDVQQLQREVSVEYQDVPVNAPLHSVVVRAPAPQVSDPMAGYEPAPAYQPPARYDATLDPPAVAAPAPAPAQHHPHPVSQPAPPAPQTAAPHHSPPSLLEQAVRTQDWLWDQGRRVQKAAEEAAEEATRRLNDAAGEAARRMKEQVDEMERNGQLPVPGRATPVPLQYQRVR